MVKNRLIRIIKGDRDCFVRQCFPLYKGFQYQAEWKDTESLSIEIIEVLTKNFWGHTCTGRSIRADMVIQKNNRVISGLQ